MEELTLQVKGSSKDPYELTFIKDGDSLTALCDCPAGTFGNLCKHRLALLDGDNSAVVDDDKRKADTIVGWLAGTDVEAALAELRQLEDNRAAPKSEIVAAKRKVARGDEQLMSDSWLMETKRLRLRPVTVDDAALMLAVWNDPAFIANVADRGIRTDDEAREAIRSGPLQLFEDHGFGPYCMSLRTDGTMIGICGLFKRDNLDAPDIGFAVLPDYCGKGYAGEAAEAVVDYARTTLGIKTLTAIVSPTNKPSIGLIEKLGLEFERMITMPGDDVAICLYSKMYSD